MAKEIRYEPITKRFTFAKTLDDKKTESVRPAKFSAEDKYGKYRRAGMEEQRREDGLVE